MRLQWIDEPTRKEWEPQLSKISRGLLDAQLHTVGSGGRLGAIVNVRPGDQDWYALQDYCCRKKLVILPFGVAKLETYSNGVVWPAEGEPYTIRAFVSQIGTKFPEDDTEWGRVLGYPPCCRMHFTRYWKPGHHDLLLSQVGATSRNVALVFPPYSNVILKPLGIRPVFHLPCSPTCEETKATARRIYDACTVVGVDLAPMYNLLRMPITVTAKHGIAEIVHPFFRLIYDTDVEPDSWQVQMLAAGSSTVPLANSYALLWEDNGFKNLWDMENAHREILIRAVYCEGVQTILDLGAGNGLLAARLQKAMGAQARGVDSDKEKCLRAIENNVYPGDIHDCRIVADLVVIAQQRLQEERGEELRSSILPSLAKKYILLYDYAEDLKCWEFAGFKLVAGGSRRVHIFQRT